jgi:sec-independent protein translocase protein TatB
MFDVSFTELMLIGVIALIVIGPERLPKVARTIGHLLGRAQRYVSDVKTDIQREMDLDELNNLKGQMEEAAKSVKSSMKDATESLRKPLDEAQQALKEASASVETLVDSTKAEVAEARHDSSSSAAAPVIAAPAAAEPTASVPSAAPSAAASVVPGENAAEASSAAATVFADPHHSTQKPGTPT